MAKTIITKRCCRCKQVKSLSHFCKNFSTKDKYHHRCKICHNEANRKYTKTTKGKKYYKRYLEQIPQKRKARRAISNAIRDNKILRANTLQCSCGEQAKEYHHHKGYEPEQWFDVIPVCIPCHKQFHFFRHNNS